MGRKVWHATDHESSEAQAVWRTAGNHKTWCHSCGDNLLGGWKTVVVQLFPDGCFPTSSRLCLSWPVRMWNAYGLRQCTKGDTSTSCSFTPASFPWNDCDTILYSSFLLSGGRFMDGGSTWTLHLASSSSPHRIMVFEVVLAPE